MDPNGEIRKFIDYEVANSPIAHKVSFLLGQKILGKYYAWKVRRKYNRYKKMLRARKAVAIYNSLKKDGEMMAFEISR